MEKKTVDDPTSFLIRHYEKYIPNFDVDEDKLKAMCFREKLDICTKNNLLKDVKPVGSYSISVESVGPRSHEFLVHVFTSMIMSGCCGESKVTSLVTQDLLCLEEKRSEFLQTQEGVYKKKFYLSTRRDNLYAQVDQEILGVKQENSYNYPYDKLNLLCEGNSLLLMRYLAIIDFQGAIPFDVVTVDGHVKRYIYNCSSAKPMEFNCYNLDVYTITQTMFENNICTDQKECLLTREGKILCLDWSQTNFYIKINPLLNPCISSKDPIILPLRVNWEDDMELMSLYLDKKISEFEKDKNYLLCNEGITSIIEDYLQTLLAKKPNDVVNFTIKYFVNFKNDTVAHKCLESDTSESDLRLADIFNCDENQISCLMIKDSQSSQSTSNSSSSFDGNINIYSVSMIPEIPKKCPLIKKKHVKIEDE